MSDLILCEALRVRGLSFWYDNGQCAVERNLVGMQDGVSKSMCLLLFLSGRKETMGMADASFTRWFCHKEMAAARKCNLPVVGVMEMGRSPQDAGLCAREGAGGDGGGGGCSSE